MGIKISLNEIEKILTDNNLLQYSNKINDNQIEYLSFDSRDIKTNTLFFCKGLNYKAEYLNNAIKAGSNAYISEKEYSNEVNFFIVNDIRKSMCVLASYFYQESYKEIETIAITGTKGKTTVTYFLKNILDEYLNDRSAVISTIEVITGQRQQESHLTTPEPIDLHKYFYETKISNIKYLTMEVTSQAYKTGRVDGVNFKHGMFLNIALDHISDIEHTDFEDYFSCKLKLIENVEDMIINKDMDHFDTVIKTCEDNNVKYTTYGKTNTADYYYTSIRNENNKLYFTVKSEIYNFEDEFCINMLGRFNVENALASIVMALNLNINTNVIKAGLLKTTVTGRMNIFTKEEISVIVDYAHNELSFNKLYESLKLDFPNKNIISVGGAPGNKAYKRREEFGAIVGGNSDFVYITTEDPQYENPMDISVEISNFLPHNNYEIILDRKEAIKNAINNAKENDVIVLLAKGEEDYQKVNGEFVFYESDLVLAKQFLDEKEKNI